MRVAGYEIGIPQAVLILFAVLVVGGILYGSATSAVAFGAFNPSWEGTSDLQDIASESGSDTEVAADTTDYESHGDGTVAVILTPDEPYDEADIERIQAFLDRGGTLLVADRDGTGNELLEAIGASSRVDGAVLRDERNYYKDPALPEATQVADHPLTEDVDRLTFNYGTAIDAGDSTVLVSSSEFAYLDENGNEELDDAERLDSYPVATTEDVENGRVVVVGDPSAFINVMLERPGNRQFARNVFADSDTVLIDTSHSGDLPPLIGALVTVRSSSVLQSLLVVFGLAVLFVWQLGILDREEDPAIGRRPSPETLAESAAEQYPEYDRGRLRRLMKGIKSISPEEGDDE